MRLSFESALKKPRTFPIPGPRRQGRKGESLPVLPESLEHEHSGRGFCGNLGDPAISTE